MELIDRIKGHEGLKLQVYDDKTGKPIGKGSVVVGNPTIGWGILLSSPGGITEEEAEYLVRRRVEVAQAAALALLGGAFRIAEPVRFDVFAEMAYQMGGKGLASFGNTIRAAREGRFGDTADGMLASLWARQQTPGRAKELAKIMRSGIQ